MSNVKLLPRDLVAPDDAGDLLALLGVEDPDDRLDRPLRDRPHEFADGFRRLRHARIERPASRTRTRSGSAFARGRTAGRTAHRVTFPSRSIVRIAGRARAAARALAVRALVARDLPRTASSWSPRLPSTARMRSPGFRTLGGGVAGAQAAARSKSALSAPNASAKRIRKAISRFITGPAPITTIRFQTGWW